MENVIKNVVTEHGDHKLDDEPVTYGNVPLNEAEKLVLKLRPEFPLFLDLNVLLIHEEMESCLAKL